MQKNYFNPRGKKSILMRRIKNFSNLSGKCTTHELPQKRKESYKGEEIRLE